MRQPLALALALLFGPAVEAAPAAACGNSVYLDTDAATRLLARAARALERGQHRQALRLLRGQEDPVEMPEALEARRTFLISVARMRLGEVAAALPALRRAARAHPDDALVQARLAEALAQTRGGTEEALKILGDLETRDLMPDAMAFATLSRLRRGKQDAAGERRAAARCRQLARKPELCPAVPHDPVRSAS